MCDNETSGVHGAVAVVGNKMCIFALADLIATVIIVSFLAEIGLAFIAFPQALSMIPYPNFWSAVFFTMLFFLAIDTEVSCQFTSLNQ